MVWLHRILQSFLRFSGVVIENQDEAEYIIYPPIDEKKTEDWIRIVQKKGKDALVHFWYTPDSHDTWIQNVDMATNGNDIDGDIQQNENLGIDLQDDHVGDRLVLSSVIYRYLACQR